MFLLGICVHLVFLFSIFDIYFKSPIVKNVNPFTPSHEATANRLVLFVVDGLRAESFVNYTTMPYLRSIANTIGRWGVSNTRVPTESRPGHVAVIAGFYEDPSAVAKGWKENPVDFDSVFNQTRYTWCWGTYDIVDIFTKDSTTSHISVDKLDPYDQTFSTDKNTTLLDEWVFDKVKHFFVSAKHDSMMIERLKNDKILFFLHLLGTDTSGHTHKPKTPNFLTTLMYVDEGIKEIEKLIRDFYDNDGKTTFLMTSDHGMTDWGSHGTGDDHETQTPYVLWGAGVQQADKGQHDDTTLQMSLNHRLDINQANLAPLMSTILSISVPVNSIGKLNAELLDMSLSNKAKAIYSNSRQLAAQYDKKRKDVEANAIPLLYKPYEPFNKKKLQEILTVTEILLENEEYEKLILLCEEVMDLSLSGLDYYHNYYQYPLLILVTLSFLGWIACLLKLLAKHRINTHSTNDLIKVSARKLSLIHKCLNTFFFTLSLTAIYIVFAQKLPLQYYIYFLLPLYLWRNAIINLTVWVKIFEQLKTSRGITSVFLEGLCYFIGSMILGLSFTYRWMLSIPMMCMGVWPFFSYQKNNIATLTLLAWPVGCMLLSFFSFMPVVGKDVFIELVIFAGLLWLTMTAVYLWKVLLPLCLRNEESKKELILTALQTALLILSLQNIYIQSMRFEKATPVLNIYQYFAWAVAAISLILPIASSRRVLCRLFIINASILTIYLLLSVSHEGIFMVVLITNVTCWMFIEFKFVNVRRKVKEFSFNQDMNGKNSLTAERSISNEDFRRSFFFISYIVLAFFGTGNIASLNSFEIRWVTCFITSYQPFVITGLILFKTLSPFLSVACSLRAVQLLTKAPIGYLNIIVMIYSNLMGIQLLYNVKNTGSWLEIGTSISQFVIVQVITLFIVLINQIAKVLTDYDIYNRMFKSRKKYL